jgi:hypothetical protein
MVIMQAGLGISTVVALGLWAAPGAKAQNPFAHTPACPDTGQVGTVYGIVRASPSNAPVRNAQVIAVGTSCSTLSDSAGRYVLRGVPAGMVPLLAGFIGYHLATDTVLVPVHDSVQHVMALGEMEEEPKPYTTVPLPKADRRAATVSVLNFYRQRQSGGEAAGYVQTLRVTNTPMELASGGVPFVLWLGGSDAVYRQDTAWARAQRLPVCWTKHEAYCPGRGVTTFLKLSAPRRISPDSVVFSVSEIVTDPAACRRETTFVGFAEHAALVVRDHTGWHQVRFLDQVNLAGSGYCGPSRR